jgi:hypothetical protein
MTGRAGKRNCLVIGITRPVIRREANNVLMMGPGEMMTLRAKMPMMEMKIYCPSRPSIIPGRCVGSYHSTDDAVMIRLS